MFLSSRTPNLCRMVGSVKNMNVWVWVMLIKIMNITDRSLQLYLMLDPGLLFSFFLNLFGLRDLSLLHSVSQRRDISDMSRCEVAKREV